MSVNQSLERYKELYSKYVEARVGLHNYHTVFVKHLGYESSVGVRKCITEMAKLEVALRAAVRATIVEQIAIEKALKKEKKQQKNRDLSGLEKSPKRKRNVDISGGTS